MKKTKKLIKSGVCLLLAVALLLASLLGRGTEVVEASTRMYGIQQIVDNMSSGTPFTILEIVPDKTYASFGYYVNGQEPEIAPELLSGSTSKADRVGAVVGMLGNLSNAGIISNDTAVLANIYQEQIFAPTDLTGWAVLSMDDASTADVIETSLETRTGYYAESEEAGLEYGNYTYTETTASTGSYTYVGDGNGEYVWIDASADTEGAAEAEVQVGKIYYRTQFTDNNWFANNVLEVENSENIQVITMTPAELETQLTNAPTYLEQVDLLYLSATDILKTEYALNKEYKAVVYDTAAGNDISMNTITAVSQLITERQLSVIVDNNILTLTGATGIHSLASSLKGQQETTAVGVDKNIYFGTNIVSAKVAVTENGIYGYNSVLEEIQNEDFYNEANGWEYTSEYDETTDSYQLTNATLMKYILNYVNRREVVQKQSIRILDIEPAKYSTLTEDTIREWLGETSEDSGLEEIVIEQMSTAEFIGRNVDLIEKYDMIYIGSCVGDGKITGSIVEASGITEGGYIYSDRGDNVAISFGDGSAEYAGNDITALKRQDLTEYVESGYPVVVSKDLLSTAITVDSAKVKDSSEMYSFLDAHFKAYARNVINEQAITSTQSSTAANLVQYINIPKMELEMISVPDEYSVTYTNGKINEVDALLDNTLNFEFVFTDDARGSSENISYRVRLFVDSNADGVFSSYEEQHQLTVKKSTGASVEASNLEPNVNYTLTKKLSADYQGLIPWKLTINVVERKETIDTAGAATTKETILSTQCSSTGKAFAWTDDDAVNIKVLQLTDTGNGTLNLQSNTQIQSLLDDLDSNLDLYSFDITTASHSSYLGLCSSAGISSSETFYNTYLKEYDMLVIGEPDSGVSSYGTYAQVMTNAIEWFIRSGKSVVFTTGSTSHTITNTQSYEYYLNELVRKEAAMEFQKTTAGGTDNYTNVMLDEDTTSAVKSYVYARDSYGSFTTSQINEGQITSYPYDLNVEENTRTQANTTYYKMSLQTQSIKETKAQSYQLDMNRDADGDGLSDVTVWYTLADNTEGLQNDLMSGDISRIEAAAYVQDLVSDLDNAREILASADLTSIDGILALLDKINGVYAASPNDVRNNYYIYSIDNVTYTGMGSSNDLSDYEAKLFVNTLVTAYTQGIKNPEATIIEDKSDLNSSIDNIYRAFDEELGNISTDDEEFYFYIRDNNVLTNGNKTFDITCYLELNAPISGITHIVENGRYFVKFNPVLDGNIGKVTIPADTVNKILDNQSNITIVVGVQTNIVQGGTTISETEWVYDTITINKLTLFDLD